MDLDGIRHAVEVEADSLFEAAVLALTAFKKHDLELPRNGLHELNVEIRTSITHTVPVRNVYQWLERGVKSPKELALKERLRAML